MEDCPECGKLIEIEARLAKGDVRADDMRWLIRQLGFFQRWAVKVINFIDPIRALHDAYNDLFKGEEDGQRDDRPGNTGR